MSGIFQLLSTYVSWGTKPSTEKEVCVCCMLCVVTVIWDCLTSKIHHIRMVIIDTLISYPVYFRFYSFLFYWMVSWHFCVSECFLGRCILLQQWEGEILTQHGGKCSLVLSLLFIVPGHFRNIPLWNSKNPFTI